MIAITFCLSMLMFLLSSNLFSMEPNRALQTDCSQKSPLESLPEDVKVHIASFLTRGKGLTYQAQLNNAAESLRIYMSLSKSFVMLLRDKAVNKLLVEKLAFYTGGNLIKAALALSTVGATQCIESFQYDTNYPIENEINYAAAHGDTIALNKLLKWRSWVISPNTQVHAGRGGHLAAIEILYAPTIGLVRTKLGRATPLIVACQNGHMPVVKRLLELGVDPCAVHSQGKYANDFCALTAAAWQGNKNIVSLLLDTRARQQINWQDRLGRTPLFWAAQAGHSDVVNLLLAAGAQVNMVSNEPSTALLNSIGDCNRPEYVTIVKALVAAGAQINYRDMNGKTALYYARLNAHNSFYKKQIERILLDHGAIE